MSESQIWMAVLCPLMIVGVLGILAINDRQKRRLVEKAWAKGEKPNRRYLNNRSDWKLNIWMLIGFPVLVAISLLFRDLPPAAREILRGFARVLAIIACVIVVLLILLILGLFVLNFFLRRRFQATPLGRDLAEIERLRLAGKIDEALELNSSILNGSGIQPGSAIQQLMIFQSAILNGMRGQWEDALALVEQVEASSISPNDFGPTKALMLWQLGDCIAAEAGLRDWIRTKPHLVVSKVALGLLLAEQNRGDEALDLLHTLDLELAKHIFNKREEEFVEHLRRATNAMEKLSTPVTPAEFDPIMRRLLEESTQGVVFRERKEKRSESMPT